MSLSNMMILKENVVCGGRELDMRKCIVMFLMDLSGREWSGFCPIRGILDLCII